MMLKVTYCVHNNRSLRVKLNVGSIFVAKPCKFREGVYLIKHKGREIYVRDDGHGRFISKSMNYVWAKYEMFLVKKSTNS